MKKPPQQPDIMDEWLLNPTHGLEEVDKQSIHHHFKRSDFLNTLTFQYVCATRTKRTPYWLEQQIKRFISRSIWPRILVMRCRLLIYTALPLIEDGHWELMDAILTDTRIALHYMGCIMHGLRFAINIATLIEHTLSSEDSALVGFTQQIEHTWFELCNDTIWIISALIPSSYLAVSCILMVLELGLIAIRAWIEISHLSNFKTAFSTALANPDLNSNSVTELTLSEAHARAMLDHTYNKFVLNICVTLTTTLLFLLKYVIIPSVSVTIAANLVVPFVFATLALSISIANHYISQHIDKDKPKIKLEHLSGVQSPIQTRNTFFKVNAPDPVHADPESVLAP